jgi:hypothetical protein
MSFLGRFWDCVARNKPHQPPEIEAQRKTGQPEGGATGFADYEYHLPKAEWVQIASIENRELLLEVELTRSPRRANGRYLREGDTRCRRRPRLKLPTFRIKMLATALAISRDPFVNPRWPAPMRGGFGLADQMLRQRCDTGRQSLPFAA